MPASSGPGPERSRDPVMSAWRALVGEALADAPLPAVPAALAAEGVTAEPFHSPHSPTARVPPFGVPSDTDPAHANGWACLLEVGPEVLEPGGTDPARAAHADGIVVALSGRPEAGAVTRVAAACARQAGESLARDARPLAWHVDLPVDAGAALTIGTAWTQAAAGRPVHGALHLGVVDLAGSVLAEPQLAQLVRDVPLRSIVTPALTLHEAGATSPQELGWSLAATVTVLRQLAAENVPPQALWPRLTIVVALDADPFLTASKVRAARWLWQRLGEVCGATPVPRAIAVQARLGARTLSPRAPWNNLLRATTAALGAALAGVDSVVLCPARFGLPGDVGDIARLASIISPLLREEGHLHRIRDPLAGSATVETRTRWLAQSAWEYFQETERRGGLPRALADGWVDECLAAAVLERRQLGVRE